MAVKKLPTGWGVPGSAVDEVAEAAQKGGKGLVDLGKKGWRAIFGSGKKAEVPKAPVKTPSKAAKTAKKVAKGGLILGGAATVAKIGGNLAGGPQTGEGYDFELGDVAALEEAGYNTDVLRDLIEKQRQARMGGAGGGGGDYSGVRRGFENWANTMRDYERRKAAALGGTYQRLSEQADADALAAEAIANMAYEDIGRVGSDFAAAATRGIESAGPAGPTATTGLVPVSGELADIPGQIQGAAKTSADYVLGNLNLTRDDLRYMGDVAQMMGPAYAAQLSDNINMAIAERQFELDQRLAEQAAADARAAAGARSQADADYYDQLIALETMSQQQQGGVGPYELQAAADQFQTLLNDPRGRQSLKALGIDTTNPTRGFQQYLAQERRRASGSSSRG
jgi:hypothetical protein